MANNKLIDTMEVALLELAPNKDNIIFVSATEVYDKINTSANIVELSDKFDTQSVLDLIGDVRYIGIINSNKIKQFTKSNLTSIFQNKSKITVVVVNDSPISCEIIYPEPEVGERYLDGNYEYRYGLTYSGSSDCGMWEVKRGQTGWGVKVIDSTQVDYVSPLTIIQNYPVTNMSFLFYNNQSKVINLINWDTCNVNVMSCMFYECKAKDIFGLYNFDTSKVTTMAHMFQFSVASSLDLSSFDTSNVVSMDYMFTHSRANSLDLSSFDTTSIVSAINMFQDTKMTSLDLSSFDMTATMNTENMFSLSSIANLTARTQADANKYIVSYHLNFPITVKFPML